MITPLDSKHFLYFQHNRVSLKDCERAELVVTLTKEITWGIWPRGAWQLTIPIYFHVVWQSDTTSKCQSFPLPLLILQNLSRIYSVIYYVIYRWVHKMASLPIWDLFPSIIDDQCGRSSSNSFLTLLPPSFHDEHQVGSSHSSRMAHPHRGLNVHFLPARRVLPEP